MPARHIETRNIVFHKAQVRDGSYQHENFNLRRTKSMSRTIEAFMRHMSPPSNRTTDPRNGVEKLEKEITVKKRHYIWPESRFVRTMLPFHSNIRVGYNGTEVDGKSVLDLMTLAPPEGTKVRIRIAGSDAAEAMHAVDQLMQRRSDDD
jgi:phosphocarrier protein HPr